MKFCKLSVIAIIALTALFVTSTGAFADEEDYLKLADELTDLAPVLKAIDDNNAKNCRNRNTQGTQG